MRSSPCPPREETVFVELNSQVIASFALILIAAALNGAYAIPLRFMMRWKWKNIWAVGCRRQVSGMHNLLFQSFPND